MDDINNEDDDDDEPNAAAAHWMKDLEARFSSPTATTKNGATTGSHPGGNWSTF